ncbi:hypothetical protein [Flavobacterium sp. HTF]|uniref:hypothetical protein n=1 Tax=Flavobacterium sp. HTF TaxID=2170732 RepID=UPI000D5C8B99|nr:hypothetical protein [Flavobacterium sp. HTF]PWB25538.1 hypothetical protein DCO46_08495 [Flavobacterium sp. HTF]
MKKLFALTLIIMVGFVSCKKTDTVTGEIAPSAPKVAESAEPTGNQCYSYSGNNSMVDLSFNVNSHQEVNGTLSYNLSEKDKNEGILVGNMKGDTLIADYTFTSEGVSSVREVAFLNREGTFIEGYGETVEANDKIVFKDKSKLIFDQKNILVKVDCKPVQ